MGRGGGWKFYGITGMNTVALIEETRQKLQSLVDVIRSSGRLLILTHDNPDPDSMASACALQHLIHRMCNKPAAVAYGGVVGRAENRAMVRELRLHMIHIHSVRWDEYDALALVDHQPRKGWIRWPDRLHPAIIIDHHPLVKQRMAVPFADIRKGFGSNSSLLWQYLKAADIPIPKPLATAMVYGIQSDTQGFFRTALPPDLDAYMAMFRDCDHKKLRTITHPSITSEYFQNYWDGMRHAVSWGDTITSFAGVVEVPDLISDIADRMVTIEGVRWSMASGFHDNVLYISVREHHERRDVGRIIRQVVGRLGSAGGHGFMAGAQIRNVKTVEDAETLSKKLQLRFVKTLHPREFMKLHPVSLLKTA